MLKLRDLLNRDWENIEYRMHIQGYDIFAGLCQFIDHKLISLDGDTYSLDDKIEEFEGDEDVLTVWIKV